MTRDEDEETRERAMADTDEVRAVVDAVRSRRRGRLRWNVGRHTAELAIDAFEESAGRASYRRSSKSRRRKRFKRLL